MKSLWRATLAAAMWNITAVPIVLAATPATEQQVKAVFVFKLAHFVAWPPESFGAPEDPFVICVLGNGDFAAQVREAARDERLDTHPLQVRQLAGLERTSHCKIIYIDRSYAADLPPLLAAVSDQGILTVSDHDDAARRGVMIQLALNDNRIGLVVNAGAARDAGLTISSNVLRLATIVRTGGR